MPPEHRAFFNELELWFESPDCMCVHAGLDPHVLSLSDQRPRSLFSGHGDFPAKYQGATPVVYGIGIDVGPNGRPTPHATGNTIGIDTIAYGVLTAILYGAETRSASRRTLVLVNKPAETVPPFYRRRLRARPTCTVRKLDLPHAARWYW
jgi:hypothetical protein